MLAGKALVLAVKVGGLAVKVRGLAVKVGGQADHPANVHAAALDDVAAPDGFFDDIEYQKGGCILRMLRAYLNSNRIAAPQLAYATGGRKLFQVLPCSVAGFRVEV